MQQLQWADKMFRQRRTAFYPVAVIAVKHAVDVAQFQHGEYGRKPRRRGRNV